jgi:hypothetical protein
MAGEPATPEQATEQAVAGEPAGQAAVGKPAGQTITAYLKRYWWAVLILAVAAVVLIAVVAVFALPPLLYLGVFNTKGRTPEICTLPIGLQCPDFKLSTNGVLNLKITNGNPRAIVVSGVQCTNDPAFNAANFAGYQATSVTIQPGYSQPVSMTCYDTGGKAAAGKAAAGNAGDTYRGSLYVKYAFENEPKNYRVAVGDIVTTRQP